MWLLFLVREPSLLVCRRWSTTAGVLLTPRLFQAMSFDSHHPPAPYYFRECNTKSVGSTEGPTHWSPALRKIPSRSLLLPCLCFFVVVTSPWRGQSSPWWHFRADQGTEWRISQNTAFFVKIIILIYVNGVGYCSNSDPSAGMDLPWVAEART